MSEIVHVKFPERRLLQESDLGPEPPPDDYDDDCEDANSIWAAWVAKAGIIRFRDHAANGHDSVEMVAYMAFVKDLRHWIGSDATTEFLRRAISPEMFEAEMKSWAVTVNWIETLPESERQAARDKEGFGQAIIAA
jgi:hypothetical protein